MAAMRIPDEPYTIESIMEDLGRQFQQESTSPAGGQFPSSVGSLIAKAESARRIRPDRQARSHRRFIGPIIDLVKRFVQWGSRPYIDAAIERQEQFNDAALAALQAMAADVERISGRFALAPFFHSLSEEKRLALSQRFRGPEKDIAAAQSRYIEILRGRPGPVLDLGCGRGEMLRLLREKGIQAWGCDTDPSMVSACQKHGLDARPLGVLEALRSATARSLGAVFSAQVIEHLYPAEILELLRLALSRLAPGGALVLESLNPRCIGALAKSYFKDLEHKQPVDPEYLAALLEALGFERVSIHMAMPFEEWERMKDLPPAESLQLSPEAGKAMQGIVDRLNQTIWGPQDYYIVAEAPAVDGPDAILQNSRP